jgi:ribosomal protein S18 acetylase RimI-like enzyme
MSSPEIQLIRATPADLPRLLDWMKLLRIDDPMETTAVVPVERSRIAMRDLLGDDSLGRAWVIQRDEDSVGYVALTFCMSIEFGGRIAFIDELFIDRGFRRQGIGRRVLGLVTDEARQLGARALLLEVSEDNAAAVSLYKSSGFGNRQYRTMTKLL